MEHIEPPGFDIVDVGALQHRIDELLKDNDDLRMELWAKDRVIQLMVEKIDEMEREGP